MPVPSPSFGRTRGPRLPRTISLLIALTLATSIVAAIDPSLYGRLALIPSRVVQGELWRLVTWSLVEASPLALILTCISIFWFGTALISAWGERRFAWFLGAVVGVAAAGTTLLSLVSPHAASYPHLAGWAVTDALVIAWALTFPDLQLRVYGLLVVGGKRLAHGTVAVTLLFVIFYGLVPFLPELLACAVALTATSGWWRTRRTRFTVIQGGRHGGPFGN